MTVQEWLRLEMDRRGWNVPQLADAADVSVGLAAKWVSENGRYRVNPSPASCRKIATALGTDPDYVLALAGHREEADPKQAALTAQEQAAHAELDAWIALLGETHLPTLMRGLRSTAETIQAVTGTVCAVRPAEHHGRGRNGAAASREPEDDISYGAIPHVRNTSVRGRLGLAIAAS